MPSGSFLFCSLFLSTSSSLSSSCHPRPSTGSSPPPSIRLSCLSTVHHADYRPLRLSLFMGLVYLSSSSSSSSAGCCSYYSSLFLPYSHSHFLSHCCCTHSSFVLILPSHFPSLLIACFPFIIFLKVLYPLPSPPHTLRDGVLRLLFYIHTSVSPSPSLKSFLPPPPPNPNPVSLILIV